MFHVYLGYCYVETADLSQGQLEEVCAELYSHERYNMEKTIDTIYKKLQELK